MTRAITGRHAERNSFISSRFQPKPGSLLGALLYGLGDRIFARSDRQAALHQLEVVRTGPFRRSYRDPRWGSRS